MPGSCYRAVPWVAPHISISFPWSLGCIRMEHEGCGTQPVNIKMRYLRYLLIMGVNCGMITSGTGCIQCLQAGKETEVFGQFDGRIWNDSKS